MLAIGNREGFAPLKLPRFSVHVLALLVGDPYTKKVERDLNNIFYVASDLDTKKGVRSHS